MTPERSWPETTPSYGPAHRLLVRGLWLLTAAVLASLPARANLRAPLRVDGFFSGSVRGLPLSQAVRLVGEELRLTFPDFDEKLSAEGPRIVITVRYEIVNDQAGEVEFAVHFLAVDIAGLKAALDGRALEVELAPDTKEKSECLWRLTRHRSAFAAPLYKGYLERVREAAGLREVPDAEWLGALEGRDLSGVEPSALYSLMRLTTEAADFQSAGMRLRLRPGTNALEISYSQRMFIDERDHGYFTGWPEKGFTGADYLLYPAVSWPLDPAFRLQVSVEIPELSVKRFLHRTWLRPFVRSNLKLEEEAPARPHARRLKGEFPGFPADILTVLFWFDEKARRYLGN
jgi:hypothetical protein